MEYRPAAASVTLDYDLKPMTFVLGARCGPPDDIGFRSAVITVENELPMRVEVQYAAVDPEVCNATVLEVGKRGGFSVKSAALGALGAALAIWLGG